MEGPEGGLVYAAQGALSGMTLGSAKYEETCYNSRLQPIGIRVGAGATGCVNSSDLLNLAFSYGSTNNNGNLNSEGIVASGGANVTQSFGYDNVNRLSTGSEVAGTTTTWSRGFNYDQWGNMCLSGAGGTPGVPVDATTPQTSNPPACAWIDTAHNRLTNAGMNVGYDSAGNLTTMGLTSAVTTYAYDAESRLTSRTLSGTASTYVYDGDGRRVQKVSGGTTTTYVYDAGGELTAEYTNTPPPTAPCTTCYLTADHLGSTRMMTNASGTVKSLHDYLPFGEEIPGTMGGRTTPLYPPSTLAINDGVTEKFTGKERDVETGLDFMEARYFSSAQGRFTSPDPVYFQKEMLIDPQRFNAYAYGRNNPLEFVDPTGEAIQLSDDAEERKKQLEGLRNLSGDKNGNYLYENKVGDHYYVGIMAGGQSGQDKDFGSTNAVAGDLQKIIQDPHVASLHLVSKNEQFDTGPGTAATLSGMHAEGATVTLNGQTNIYIHDPTKPYAPLDFTQNETWGDLPRTFETVMAHELGHFGYRIGHPGAPMNSPAEKKAADDLENKVRRLEDKNAPIRTRHDSLIP